MKKVLWNTCVGAGLGGAFENTLELHVMNYKAVMKVVNKPKWDLAVNEEHERRTRLGSGKRQDWRFTMW